jgi:transposase-like protein
MGKRGRLYSPEFKEEAVRLVHSSNERYPVAKIARDLDVSTETLRRLRKEVKVLKEEREILKKRPRSSPGMRTSERAGDLHFHRDGEGEPPGEYDVQGLESLKERLLRLARQSALGSSSGRRPASGEDHSPSQSKPAHKPCEAWLSPR